MLIGQRARIRMCPLPTPLEELPRFSAALGGPRILIKRDDLTGLALGGNKARKLEFLLGDAVAAGADVVVTCGGPQSNHARQVAGGAARLGMRACLVLGAGEHRAVQGNVLLDHLLGAEIRWVDTGDAGALQDQMVPVAEELRKAGHRPYIIPLGGASASGCAAYANCVLEMASQFDDMGIVPDWLFVATGSGGTQAGLVVGARWIMPAGFRIGGISVMSSGADSRERVARHANATAELLGAAFRFDPAEVTVYDQYLGPGYGKMTSDCLDAILLMARTEGILLDPVYTGKAVAGMIDLIRQGVVAKGDTVVFLHTGGAPALFAYHRELEEMLRPLPGQG